MAKLLKQLNSPLLQKLIWLIAGFGHGAILLGKIHEFGQFEILQLGFAISFSWYWFFATNWLNSKRFIQAFVGLAVVGVHSIGFIALLSFIALLILFLGITVSHFDWQFSLPVFQTHEFKVATFARVSFATVKNHSFLFGTCRSNRGPPVIA